MAPETGIRTATAAMLATPMTPWRELRALGPEDAAAAISDYGLYNKKDALPLASSVNLSEKFGNSFGGLVLGIYAGAEGANNPAANDTFGLDILAYRVGAAGPPLLVAQVAATAGIVGTLPVDYDPVNPGTALTNCLWVDTLVLSFDDSPFGPVVYDSAANRVALTTLDACGCQDLVFNVHGADGAQAGEAPAIRILGWAF